jgi:hypothetical protein
LFDKIGREANKQILYEEEERRGREGSGERGELYRVYSRGVC